MSNHNSKAVYYHLGTTMVKLPNQTVHDMLEHAVNRHVVQAIQAQHQATWAMAMNYAVKNCTRPHHLLNAPCPPINTNPTKDGEFERREKCLEELMNIEKDLKLDD